MTKVLDTSAARMPSGWRDGDDGWRMRRARVARREIDAEEVRESMRTLAEVAPRG